MFFGLKWEGSKETREENVGEGEDKIERGEETERDEKIFIFNLLFFVLKINATCHKEAPTCIISSIESIFNFFFWGGVWGL